MRVAIIGGGIVGVTAALTLAEAGVEVIVIERGSLAGEASGLNAGVIGGGGWGHAPDLDVTLKMGSRERYLDLADNRGHDFGLERTGTLTLLRTPDEWDWAAAAVEADRAAGRVTELVDDAALLDMEPAADPRLLGAILDPLGTRAEPVAATEAFAAAARAAGAVVEIGTSVDGLGSAPGGGWELELGASRSEPQRALGTDVVIIAAGPWCADIGAMVGVDIPIEPVRGQMWASTPQPGFLRHAIASAESLLAWSGEEPSGQEPPNLTHRLGRRSTRHLYGRQRRNGEIIFGGDRVATTDRTVDSDGIAVNHGHVSELLPRVADLGPARTWGGLMPFSTDGRPLIGPIPDAEGLFLAGGLASSGFGRGPMTGWLVAELVLGSKPAVDLATVAPAGRVRPLS